jgi:hypothetical protein
VSTPTNESLYFLVNLIEKECYFEDIERIAADSGINISSPNFKSHLSLLESMSKEFDEAIGFVVGDRFPADIWKKALTYPLENIPHEMSRIKNELESFEEEVFLLHLEHRYEYLMLKIRLKVGV